MHDRETRYRALFWLACFLLYAGTTARDVLPADSGEFQLVAARWGIAHPPGYPLYTVAGALWVRLLPMGRVPFRLNLLSAALAATTLLLAAEATRRWAEAGGARAAAARLGGLVTALALACAPTFWAQATTTNIRMPTLLFTAWGFHALARYRPGARGPLIALALALGLGVGHHPSLVFVALGWGLYLLLVDPQLPRQPRRWGAAAGIAALAWALPQLYLPLRDALGDAPLAPGNLTTAAGFWDHVLARGFGGDMFAFATPTDLALRLPLLPTLFRLQFPPLLLLAIGLSALWLLARRPKVAAALLVAWAVHTFVTITYRAPQTVEYLMPAYVPMALALGMGVAALARRSRSRPLAVALGLLLLVRLPGYAPQAVALANDPAIRARTAPLLAAAPPDAVILADWRWATPLWVLQSVEGLRPDVQVAYVYPEKGRDYEAVWRARAADVAPRPLLTTHAYAWDDWTFAPVGGGFRLYRRPLDALPEGLGFTPVDADLGPIRLLGYALVGAARPGRQLELRLAWQAQGPQTPAPSLTGRVWDAQGNLLAQADRALGGDTAPGEVRFTRLTLALPVDRCAATASLTLGAYTVTMEDGAHQFQDLGTATLREVPMRCAFPTLPTARPWPGYVPGGPFLRGVDYDGHGDRTIAHLHWCGPGAALTVHAGEAPARVHPLAAGACQTVRLPVGSTGRPALRLTRSDGSPAPLIALPLPAPARGERYVPFGDAMVLVGTRLTSRAGHTVLTLTWRTTRPLVNDYGISARLRDAEGYPLAIHDSQPALGALPTLKWVARDCRVRDPHPFAALEATASGGAAQLGAVTVYERFRMTPLSSALGDIAVFPLGP